MDPNSALLSPPPQACSYLAEPCMEGGRSPSPQDSPFPWNQVPSSSLTDPDCFWNEHTQAKRARVETIIRGMCLSPNLLVPGDAQTRDRPCGPEKARERKRKQRLPMQQGHLQPVPAGDQSSRKGSPRVREQLHLLKQQLRHLQEHILQAAEPRDTAQGLGEPEKGKRPRNIKQRHGYGSRPWAVDSDDHQGSRGIFPRAGEHIVSEVEPQSEEPSFLPSGARALLDILSKELTGAVCQAVDSVLQKVLLDPPGHLTHLGRSFQGLDSEGRREPSPPEGDACQDPLPRRAQSQAGGPLGNLSLATSLESPRYPISPRMIPKPYQGPPANCPLTMPSHTQENQMLSQLLSHGPNRHWNSSLPRDSPSQGHPCSESALPPRGAVKLRPSVLSQQQCPLPFTCTRVERRSLLPSVKIEQGGRQGVADALPFSSVHISFTSLQFSESQPRETGTLEDGGGEWAQGIAVFLMVFILLLGLPSLGLSC
ncbi:prospero homeobox protein 2 isoform X1 [Talpa occidentalis]|uniref:prospero homeobox protein 2 isoform X1 n=1 Tax=Talpa occidentalis TaxID=50954 RepID=UPI0023F7D691|nr:prospero homeobox protein 2 isoform X1 [Talpa occidentalis]